LFSEGPKYRFLIGGPVIVLYYLRIFTRLSKRLLKLKIYIVGKLSLDAYEADELNIRQISKLVTMATENQ